MSFSRLALAMALLAGGVLPVGGAHASELTYRPISPGFGGSPLNAPYVFGTADRTKGDNAGGFRGGAGTRDPIQGFATTLQARLLSQISGSVVDAIFGEGAEEAGRFEVGDTVIEFARGETTVRITISDIVTGSTTAIDVPLPRL